ncbi:MAG TPA: hypothetical protein VIG62_09055 [Blastocatellia bacterium]|jgi:hypothetical protein
MIYRRLLSACLIALALGASFSACSVAGDTSFKQENKPENLKSLLESLHQTIHVGKDGRQGAAVFQSLIPDEARAKKALREDIAPEALRQLAGFYRDVIVLEEEADKLARPEQTVVKINAATTEEIAGYQKGSVAFNEFPAGARRLAETVLRPGLTFYQVEFLEPGKDDGMKYHLFYWDGEQWTMLGPIWRVLK